MPKGPKAARRSELQAEADVLRSTIAKGATTSKALGTAAVNLRVIRQRRLAEPPRVCRRLHSLRDWGHEQEAYTEVFA